MNERAAASPVLRRYKPYPAYKDSGVEWLGEIPEGWQAVKLKRVCSFAYGGSLASDARLDGEIAVYGSNGPVGLHDRANTLAPCLVIGRKGSFGKVNYSARPVFAIDTTFFVDRRFTDADLRWLYYALREARLDSATKDSAIPGLDREDAYTRDLCLPPELEQRAIAAFLDRETGRIDALVAKKERLIELLQEKRTALITRAVTKGLDPTVPMKDSGVEWHGEIPAHWRLSRLKEVAPAITVGIVVTPAKYYVDEGVPCLRSLNITRGYVDMTDIVFISPWANDLHRKSKIFVGDVLVVRTGKAGTAIVVPPELDGANCIDLLIIRRSSTLDSRFVYYLINSPATSGQVEAHSVGAIQEHYNTGTLAELQVPAVPLAEQRAIAAFLDRETAKLDALVAKVRDAIERLKELRTALISAAVTGKIDVREEAAT
jgi:type I restriction enzyme S subunit